MGILSSLKGWFVAKTHTQKPVYCYDCEYCYRHWFGEIELRCRKTNYSLCHVVNENFDCHSYERRKYTSKYYEV